MTENPRLFVSCCVLVVTLGGAGGPRAAAGNPAGVAEGNPYSFHGSVAECAAAERNRCDDCLPGGSCTAITEGDGNAECTQLASGDGRGYFLICINLALAIDAVDACAASDAPSCPRDPRASESISSLESNAQFLDDPACAAPLDSCLATLYGAPSGGFPGPGDGSSPPPRNTSIDCTDSCSSDSSCDSSPGCELDGASCDTSSDASCTDSGDSSGCDDSSGPPDSGDGCSGDSEDSCGSEDNSSCDSSDCGGGGDSDCSSDGGGTDCSGGGDSDCSGGGGGGGDCSSGGGGDCNVAGRRGRLGTSLPVTVAWALLPVPFAILVRRRAERRRARAASGEGAPGVESEAAP